MSGSDRPLDVTHADATSRGEQMSPYVNDAPRWFTISQAAERCHRAPRTLLNLISAYSLPVKRGWVVRHRRRHRVHLLRPDVVSWLVQVTLLGDSAARERPPR
jgi:hypothetical protein